jgi:hypothetical protein
LAARRSSRKRARGEADAVRLAFYFALVALAISIPVLSGLYLNNTISADAFNAYSSMALSLILPFIVFSYLLSRGRRLGEVFDELGISRRFLSWRNVAIGVCILLFMIVVAFLLQQFSNITGIALPTNVDTLLMGMPLSFLLFSFLIAPLNEEILFRGFLVPRIGIMASALLFALPHLLTYSSVAELAVAFVFGIAAGYAFKKTGSLYPCILAHAAVNFITILFLL